MLLVGVGVKEYFSPKVLNDKDLGGEKQRMFLHKDTTTLLKTRVCSSFSCKRVLL